MIGLMSIYVANENRYETMKFRRCGASGLDLPMISLGLWHNFGSVDVFESADEMLRCAFDLGITQFDLANNYGPLPGTAEETFGKALRQNFGKYRDELVVSSKAGYFMWDGPYGDGGSRKYLIASINQSLKRTGLDYFDIFYSHRFDPDTPLEETMGALADIVKQGKALYAGISSYSTDQTLEAYRIAEQLGLKLLIHQPSYSMFNRWVEDEPVGTDLLATLQRLGMGAIVFSPLARGLLTDRYFHGIPADSRAGRSSGNLRVEDVNEEKVLLAKELAEVAAQRGQTLSQMALSYLLRDRRVTSVLIGASSAKQIRQNVEAIYNFDFSEPELDQIKAILDRL
jgi:L-glyceraldehyde 3-phosphate reductase